MQKTKLKTAAHILLSFGFVFLSACAKVSSPSQDADALKLTEGDWSAGIIGGIPVSDADPLNKSIVAIFNQDDKSVCTGSVIAANLIITAAHCVNQINPRRLVLIFGTRLPGKNNLKPTVRQVTDFRVNQKYNQIVNLFARNKKINPDSVTEWGDIALLKFDGGLPTGYVFANLLLNSSLLRNGSIVTVAGYGELDISGGPENLRQTDLRIANVNFNPTEILMDQRHGNGVCHGDSGGPAYVTIGGQKFLFGITSRGYQDEKDNCSQYSIFTSILPQRQFLLQAARELNQAR